MIGTGTEANDPTRKPLIVRLPGDATTDTEREKKPEHHLPPGVARFLRRVLPLISPALFIIALILLHHQLEHYRFRELIRQIRLIPGWHVLGALGLTALSYLSLSVSEFLCVRYGGSSFNYRRVLPISLISTIIGNNFGNALLAGGSIRARLYSNEGLGALDIAKVVLLFSLSFWVGYTALAGFAFVFDPPHSSVHIDIGIRTVRLIGGLCLASTGTYFVLSALQRPLRVGQREISLPPLSFSVPQVTFAAADLICSAGTLYLLLPLEGNISYVSFLGIYLLALIAGIVSQVPGGVGVFETAIILLLDDPADSANILSALVLYRAIYYLFPFGLSVVSLALVELKHRRERLLRIARGFSNGAPTLIPHLLAFTTFVGGAILLTSGALPAERSRLHWLENFLPLPIMEVSHLLASLIGLGLILLARGIQRRVDAAYVLACLLLGFGIVFSLLKGFDYEEATALSVMLASLLPCRRHFYRHASLFRQPFTPVWTAAIVIVIAGSIWLGLLSYRHVEYSSEMWWQFSVRGDAPRFLRAAVTVTTAALGIALSKLLRPAPPIPEVPAVDAIARVEGIVRNSTRTNAWLALLGDKQFLLSDSGNSFIMYGVQGGSWIAMGDPVGPEEEWSELTWKFRDMANMHGDRCVFYEVQAANLHLYLDLGLSLLKIGEEGRVAVREFSLDGKSRRHFRQTLRKFEKDGIEFEIVPESDVEVLLPELRRISDSWLASKSSREKAFSLGCFDEAYLKRFPCALVRAEGRILAFANLWLGANLEEFSIDLMRHVEDAPDGTMDFLFTQLILWGKEKGYEWFSLGMAPLAGLENRPMAPLPARIGNLIFRHGEQFYNFRGLRQYKEKFDPQWEPRYIASPGGLTLAPVLIDISALIGGGLRGMLNR